MVQVPRQHEWAEVFEFEFEHLVARRVARRINDHHAAIAEHIVVAVKHDLVAVAQLVVKPGLEHRAGFRREGGVVLGLLDQLGRAGEGVGGADMVEVEMRIRGVVDIVRGDIHRRELVDERGFVPSVGVRLPRPHHVQRQAAVPEHQSVFMLNQIARHEQLPHIGFVVAEAEWADIGKSQMAAVEHIELRPRVRAGAERSGENKSEKFFHGLPPLVCKVHRDRAQRGSGGPTRVRPGRRSR